MKAGHRWLRTFPHSRSLQQRPLDFLVRKGRCISILDFRFCVVFFSRGFVYNPMFSEMTFLLTESLELVEGNEASGPAGPTTGEESFDCERRV